ncbi:(2,3-dihydroxybenzoyl)adenylate synthase [Streptomyces sp. NBC_00162]|uniref:(2,3-dihydroxybenzoyl)adenylate synthase n=1 Tax=Streptomyces sp. NBC_00162 TaxID=2903629 RepID=UPI00214B4B7A|nr:AMP-binding protein [Streptomyces sp. NBC_00162]UUU38214.1 AMP-binding protein [Streptomyces sp. NBC_00162]
MASMLKGCTPWPEEFVDRYWAAGHWRGNTLDNLLRDWALQYGPRTALVHGGTRITYAHLNRRVDRMAAGFRLRGLRAGQRVVVQLPNVPEFVISVFALMRAGVVPVFCPISHRASEVSQLVQVTQAVGYVGPSAYQGFDHTAMTADIAARGPFLRRVFTLEAPGSSSPYGGLTTDPAGCQYSPLGSIDAPPEPALAQRADQVAFFLLSGGTAEALQLIPRTHNDYAYQARAAAELVSLTENDVYLAALPAEFNFTFGCPGIVGTLSVGGTVVLVEDPRPAECLAVIGRERVTITSVVPAVARLWLEALPTVQADLSSLRLVQIGGAPLDRATAERVGPELGCRLQQVFGTAEGLLTLTRPADPDETVLTTQGRPLSPDDEIRIVGVDGEDVPDGEPGELLARGPCTLRGYYRAPDHNARSFTADGYFRTGALARRTRDGNLVVTGRLNGPRSRSTSTT